MTRSAISNLVFGIYLSITILLTHSRKNSLPVHDNPKTTFELFLSDVASF